jgi:transposase-like protein
MARRSKRRFTTDFKVKVALEAIKEEKTITALCQEYEVFPAQIKDWKSQLLAHIPKAFDSKSGNDQRVVAEEQSEKEAELYEQIGRLKMELEWLKKKVQLR